MSISPRDHSADFEQLEYRYLRLQDQMANATASYESLLNAPDASERRLSQTRQHVYRVRQELAALRAQLEQLEDRD